MSMREGSPVAGAGHRRIRLASPVTALVLGGVLLALLAAAWPFAGLAHLSVNGSTGGAVVDVHPLRGGGLRRGLAQAGQPARVVPARPGRRGGAQ
jgi:hypothetical protein